MEFRHPWFRPSCCNTNWNDYREIEEVTADQSDRAHESHSDENGNHRREFSYTSERNDRRLQRRTESPTHRGPSTEMAPLVLSD